MGSAADSMKQSYSTHPAYPQPLTDSAKSTPRSAVRPSRRRQTSVRVQPARQQGQEMPPPPRSVQVPLSFETLPPHQSLGDAISTRPGSEEIAGPAPDPIGEWSAFDLDSFRDQASSAFEPEWAKNPIEAYSTERGQYFIKLQLRKDISLPESLPQLKNTALSIKPHLPKLSWLLSHNVALWGDIQKFFLLLDGPDFPRFLPEKLVLFLVTHFDTLHATMSQIPDNTPPEDGYQPDESCEVALSLLWCELPAVLKGFDYAIENDLTLAAYEEIIAGPLGQEWADDMSFSSNSHNDN